jgi:hypothetical protein
MEMSSSVNCFVNEKQKNLLTVSFSKRKTKLFHQLFYLPRNKMKHEIYTKIYLNESKILFR